MTDEQATQADPEVSQEPVEMVKSDGNSRLPALEAIKTSEGGALMPASFAEQWRIAQGVIQSGLCPGLKKTAEAWLIMQRGAELGFPLVTAIEFLYPVEGRIRMSPDGAKAKALSSGLLEDFREYDEGDVHETEKGLKFSDSFRAVCYIKRRGIATPIVRTFSVADAKQAKLWPGFERSGSKVKANWEMYPKRMLAARARGFAFQDAFRDLTGGLQIRERFDLDPGERFGGVVVTPPDARDVTPARPVPAKRHPVIAQLIHDADVVAPAAAAPASPAPVAEFSPLAGWEKLKAEALRRVPGSDADDISARDDFLRECTGGKPLLISTQEALEGALKRMAEHPHFGDRKA